MASNPVSRIVPNEAIRAEEDVQVVRELISFLKTHAEELRTKGVAVDQMIGTLERQVEEVLAAANRVRELEAMDEHLTRKREHLRRTVEGLADLPPDLMDGMTTMAYLKAAAEREAERRRRGRKGVGG